jgi:hypothetical protein
MKHIGVVLLLLTACQGEDMKSATFFEKYGASELGTTKYVTANAVIGMRGPEQKMIDVSVDDTGACPVVVSIRTEYEQTAAIGGPVVARVQWGVGGGQNQVEFDVPSPKLPSLTAPLGQSPDYQPMTNPGGGVQVYIGGTSHVSVYVRNDGNMASLANTLGQAALPAAPNDYIGSPTPVKVIVHIEPAMGTGHPSVERTIWVAGGITGQITSAITPGNAIVATVPPFGQSVRVQRTPSGLPVHLRFINNFGVTYREIDLGPNDEGPVSFDASTVSIAFQNTGAANITQLQAAFDVTPI